MLSKFIQLFCFFFIFFSHLGCFYLWEFKHCLTLITTPQYREKRWFFQQMVSRPAKFRAPRSLSLPLSLTASLLQHTRLFYCSFLHLPFTVCLTLISSRLQKSNFFLSSVLEIQNSIKHTRMGFKNMCMGKKWSWYNNVNIL